MWFGNISIRKNCQENVIYMLLPGPRSVESPCDNYGMGPRKMQECPGAHYAGGQ